MNNPDYHESSNDVLNDPRYRPTSECNRLCILPNVTVSSYVNASFQDPLGQKIK